uniref:Sushi domain-containing protein n=1 Tax=Parastrongyloides trichosuri TaxID=131310 RepID=A0A0N4Z248_PARTI
MSSISITSILLYLFISLLGVLGNVEVEKSIVIVPVGQDPKTSKIKVVIPVQKDGTTNPLPCVLDDGIHENGQTFTKANFHYKCVNGVSTVIACISDDKAVIQIGRTFIKDGVKHKCVNNGDTVTYEYKTTCYQNGINYNAGDTWRNGTFQMRCDDDRISINGCYTRNEVPEILLSIGETRKIGSKKFSCLKENSGKIRYSSQVIGCERDGVVFNEGEIFQNQQIKYRCNADGTSTALGCIDMDSKVFVEVGKDIMINDIAYRCYRVGKTTFFQRFHCQNKSFEECLVAASKAGRRKRTVAINDF